MTNDEFIKISSQYKSLRDYDMDKLIADSLIWSDQVVPEDLANRLITTKKELIDTGIYKQEWFVN